MGHHLEHARQPNSLISVICLDCGPEDEVGVKRFMTEIGTCATCGSGSVLKIGAVKELKRQLHLRLMRQVREKQVKRRRQHHRR